ncbi:MAG: hypothetical protein U5O69_02510 [Candidatus Competibacteraceae bacterium]|nr:hypothetical protein [Candidatus Competibacteraceae bacterium]
MAKRLIYSVLGDFPMVGFYANGEIVQPALRLYRRADPVRLTRRDEI